MVEGINKYIKINLQSVQLEVTSALFKPLYSVFGRPIFTICFFSLLSMSSREKCKAKAISTLFALLIATSIFEVYEIDGNFWLSEGDRSFLVDNRSNIHNKADFTLRKYE